MQAGQYCMLPVIGSSERLQMLMGINIQVLCEVKMLLFENSMPVMVVVASTFQVAYIMVGHL